MEVRHHTADLFTAPLGSALVHACNAQGTWGRGIAVGFRERFPKAHDLYKTYCRGTNTLGMALGVEDAGYFIGCLITSQGYGQNTDSADDILMNTRLSLKCFLSLCKDREIYSNKFNSGLFKVDWSLTEAIIKEQNDERVWNVWTPKGM